MQQSPPISDAEIDERLWPGAAMLGWKVEPRGDIEAARRNCTWTYIEPSGTRHRRKQEAAEAYQSDIDRRLWEGACLQGWTVQPRGSRTQGKWWYIDGKGTKYESKNAARESLGQVPVEPCGCER